MTVSATGETGETGETGGAASGPLELAPSEAAGTGAGLAGFAPGARRVLEALKLAGDASAEQLAASIGVTVSAVRQQLGPLEDADLVAHRDHRAGPGRPRRRYCLAPAAEALWPKRYGALTNELLGFIEETAPDAVSAAFDRRGEQRRRRAEERLAGMDLQARVAGLAGILDEDGYLAGWEQTGPGEWMVSERNCAILDVAQRYGHACRSELDFLRAVLPGAEVERVTHIVEGAHACAYRVRAAS
ncbi:ArsR family transcriptional regulator [Acidiferrimicrobium sp. IK]|uniref:helix-turn-helix transcriptional regulator n=1 Tax=Acidiferrimicrobium sp. IK TaxID=2871700 RepID=UPI0021CAFDA1|nr:winged helix-turn-helix transcriptional regulator [Acidiferrimicrobium sp. IK]MCU4183266.1 ArsR family transcriptional regulator [Acidiferrimicrobium sp. IK]